VHLFPFMGYSELYQQFHLDEAWDSPHNLSLLDQMPQLFRSRGLSSGTTHSGLRMFEGNGAFEYHEDGGPRIRDIDDGHQLALLVMETMPQDATFWTQPDGISFNPDNPLADLTMPADSFLAATTFGHIPAINPSVAPDTFAAFASWAGGELYSGNQYAYLYQSWDIEDSVAVSKSKLDAIMLSFHNFHDVYAAFPPGDNVPTEWFSPATGELYLSWRVHL
jgi:hypothetical protein